MRRDNFFSYSFESKKHQYVSPTFTFFRHPDHSAIALYHTTERFGAAGVKEITFGQLRERVREVAAALKRSVMLLVMTVVIVMVENHLIALTVIPIIISIVILVPVCPQDGCWGWRSSCWLHPQLSRGNHCHGGNRSYRWIALVIWNLLTSAPCSYWWLSSLQTSTLIIIITRCRLELNLSGLWCVWRPW